MPTAEIITIGTELLLGETADTNTRFIARSLRGLGVDLFRTQTIGDNASRIAAVVREAWSRADIVITTGGLGPTVDDPTRQAIAEAAGLELEFHPQLWEQITQRISKYGRTPTSNQKRQAYIPRGARVIENPVGTAPAFIVEAPGKVIITLPGVPREMETLLVDNVLPYLQEHFDLHTLIKVRTLHISGLGEGVIDDLVGDLETLTNPTVGLTAHSGVVDIRIAAKAGSDADAARMIADVEKDLRTRLAGNILGADDETLEGVTLQAIAQHGWSLASFEYQTMHALHSRLSQSNHEAYRGGEELTLLPASLPDEAEAICQKYGASVCLGVIYNKMDDQREVSIFWITPTSKEEQHLSYGGHPNNAHRWAVNMALDRLRRALQGNG